MIGSSLSGITFTGLSSGIDSDSIITRLMQVESIPLQRLQSQKLQIQSRQSLLLQLKGTLSSLGAAAGALNSAAAFRPISGTSSNTDVATISAGANAAPGTFNLEVTKLAQAHKISSAAQTDVTSALNKTGFIVVNGKGVKIEAADSLTAIAQKINTASAGVVASVINGGTGAAYLTLTSSATGAKGKIQIADLAGTVASDLAIANGSDSIREAITNGATSIGFSSSTTAVGGLLGATGLAGTSFLINGIQVNVNLQTQSLADIANAINAASTGATASVRSVDKDGKTSYFLDVVGASTPTFADTDGTLKALGILQRGYGSQLVTAQDAAFKLDTVSMTSASNSVTGVIPDVTFTLLKANATTPEKSTLTLTQDNTAVKGKLKEFLNAYNGILDFIKTYSGFDPETFQSGPLFGDSMARDTQNAIADLVFKDIQGLTGPYSNLAEIGFGFDSGGKLTLDESRLDAALAANPAAVGDVFRAKGETTVSTIEYVSSTAKTKPSGIGFYDVVITQLATKGAYTAEAAQTANTATSETLTFSGALFGSTNYLLVVPSGYGQSAIVDLINNDSKLRDLVVASVDGGKLKIESKRFGSNANFSVVSNVAAGSDNSGIGTTEAGIKVTGVDVAGTLNGETATGSGQYLTGSAGNATTDGLQVFYSGSTLGAVGSIRFTKGIGTLMNELIGAYTDSINGLFTANDQSMQTQIDTITQSIADLKDRLALKEQSLRLKFSRMEQAIAQLQSQQARIASFAAQGR